VAAGLSGQQLGQHGQGDFFFGEGRGVQSLIRRLLGVSLSELGGGREAQDIGAVGKGCVGGPGRSGWASAKHEFTARET
jgi:hypothetical protein